MTAYVLFKDTSSETEILINPDLVRLVRPSSSVDGACRIFFDKEHNVSVTGDVKTVWKKLADAHRT